MASATQSRASPNRPCSQRVAPPPIASIDDALISRPKWRRLRWREAVSGFGRGVRGELDPLPFGAEEKPAARNTADQLTVEALRLSLRGTGADADAVAQLSALAGDDEFAVRRALRRIEHGAGNRRSVGRRAADYLRRTLEHR